MPFDTWASYVADTQSSKVSSRVPASAPTLAQARASAVTRAKGFGRGTVFDPVLGKWADPTVEASVAAAVSESALARGNAARDRQLRHSQSFNIIDARPLVPQADPKGPRETTESFSSRVPYNILTSAPLPDMLLTSRARDGKLAARAQAEPPRPLMNRAPSLVRQRAIDVISNRYTDDHDGRSAADAAAMRERALRRYWQTRNFDPLLQVYEDPAKDAAYEEDVRLAASVAGVAKSERMPPSLRLSLGRAYDIVGHHPTDSSIVELIDTVESRPLRRMNRGAVEDRLISHGEAVADVAEQRRLNTMRATCRMETLVDPRSVDNVTLLPRNPALLRGTFASRAPTAWERIERDLGGAGAAAALGGGAAAHARFENNPPPSVRAGGSARPAPLPSPLVMPVPPREPPIVPTLMLYNRE